MNAQTRQKLRELNRRFYQEAAQSFSESRQHPWPGWLQIPLPEGSSTPLRVLDVGCGNGRFARALHQRRGGNFRYWGLDQSSQMLTLAQAEVARLQGIESHWIQLDVLEEETAEAWPELTFDLIVAFGLIHHVPGRQARQNFVQKLADCVAPGGILVITAWQFADQPRFERRTLPWSALEQSPMSAPSEADLESGDFLLGFGSDHEALRYCHHCDEAEVDQLAKGCGLEEMARFSSDGKSENLNRYLVLKRPALPLDSESADPGSAL